MRKEIALIAIGVYVVGLLVFYRLGMLDYKWYNVYYIWDKGKDLLLITGIYFLIPKWFRKAVLPIIFFSIARLVWEIQTIFTGLNINNTYGIAWLFIILAGSCLTLFLIGLKQSPKKRQ